MLQILQLLVIIRDYRVSEPIRSLCSLNLQEEELGCHCNHTLIVPNIPDISSKYSWVKTRVRQCPLHDASAYFCQTTIMKSETTKILHIY